MRKKIDNRIRVLIENGCLTRHRSLFIVVGDQGRDQIVVLHHLLSKASVRSRPSVLWCYKKDLGFSSNKKKRMRQLQKKMKSGKLAINEDDPFELFISATNIRYTYYSETHRILGNTYGMCILQDFEALTPNLLARTIETVEGGGLIVILLKGMNSLRQLYNMTMDVHLRYRTESHQDIVARFNERFILSLSSCMNSMVIDEQYNVLPICSSTLDIQALPPGSTDDNETPKARELSNLKDSMADSQPVGSLVALCLTLDQCKALLKFVEALSEKTLRNTVVMTAARGRGKSAVLGLAIATAVGFGYSNIFVTAPSPENLKTLFEFIFKGFDTLDFQEHADYSIIQSTNPNFNKAVVRVNIFRDHRQTVQYIHPTDAQKLSQAELVCIDEAAAIPLPLVKNLLGPYVIFMSSTVNGYEGTGRSLSLKLIQQLRIEAATLSKSKDHHGDNGTLASFTSSSGRVLSEVTLNESIRYADGDGVESWLNDLLCLNVSNVPKITSGAPLPSNCDLYYVNRDTLFSYHKASETFLQRIMSLYVASHYKNSPNDLQMLSDSPAHHIFVLLGPITAASSVLPEVLCVLQVALEGDISKNTILSSLSRGKRASGDLIPWTISQQFHDHEFASLSGARIVRIATHPDYLGMGYGSRCLELLKEYYRGNIVTLNENSATIEDNNMITNVDDDVDLLHEKLLPRANLPPLLLKLSERPPEELNYIGVSYGLTPQLLKFWKRAGFIAVYIRQTTNDLTGEHTCIMLHSLDTDTASDSVSINTPWLSAFWSDFTRRFLSLLSYQFKEFPSSLGLSVLQNNSYRAEQIPLTVEEINWSLSCYDLKRLELYSQNMIDYHLIMDLLPVVARLHFLRRFDIHLSPVQSALLLGMGLQHKLIEALEKELDLPANQLLGLFNRIIRKVVQSLNKSLEMDVEKTMAKPEEPEMVPALQTVAEDLDEGETDVHKENSVSILQNTDLSQYKIEGSEGDWGRALNFSKSTGIVSMKSKKIGKTKKVNPSEVSANPRKKLKKKK